MIMKDPKSGFQDQGITWCWVFQKLYQIET